MQGTQAAKVKGGRPRPPAGQCKPDHPLAHLRLPLRRTRGHRNIRSHRLRRRGHAAGRDPPGHKITFAGMDRGECGESAPDAPPGRSTTCAYQSGAVPAASHDRHRSARPPAISSSARGGALPTGRTSLSIPSLSVSLGAARPYGCECHIPVNDVTLAVAFTRAAIRCSTPSIPCSKCDSDSSESGGGRSPRPPTPPRRRDRAHRAATRRSRPAWHAPALPGVPRPAFRRQRALPRRAPYWPSAVRTTTSAGQRNHRAGRGQFLLAPVASARPARPCRHRWSLWPGRAGFR